MVPPGRPSFLRSLIAVGFALGLLSAHPGRGQTCVPGFSIGPELGLPPRAVVVATPDLNRDGRPDLIFQAVDGIGWSLNQGGGRFVQAGFADISGGVAIGDLDGDGVPDAVLVTGAPESLISTYLGDGFGGFRLAASVTGPQGGAFSPVISDFDGDGVLDLAVVNFTTVWIFSGDGRGGLRLHSYFRPNGPLPSSLQALHRHGDDKASLLVTTWTLHGFLGSPSSYVSEGVEAWTMNGSGWGVDATTILGSTGTVDLAVGDVDGDGHDDVVTVSVPHDGGNPRIDTYLSRPAGFVLASRSTGLPHPVLADFDGDGRLDLVLFDSGYLSSRNFTLQLGDGAGGFGPPRTFTLPASASSFIAADVDGDGRIDLIASGFDNLPPLLLLNTCERHQPATPGPVLPVRPRSRIP